MKNTMRTAVMLAGAQMFAGGPIMPEYKPTPKEPQSESSKEYYLKRAEAKRQRRAVKFVESLK